MGPTDLVRLAVIWCSSRMNRHRVSGARIQACVFAVTNNPEPSILMVRSVYDEWSVPQEGVMIDETIDEAAWRGLEEEVGIRIDDPGAERQLATQKDVRYLGRAELPEERWGERPIADNVGDGVLSLVTMKAKAYWGVFLLFRSQHELVAAANDREIDAVEWCSFDTAHERVSATVREPKAELIREGLQLAQGHLPQRRLPLLWQPSDFIVHGHYCSPHQIVEELEELRLAWESKALVLIVFREDTFFRPLLRLAHEDQDALDDLQQKLSDETSFEQLGRESDESMPYREEILSSLPRRALGLEDFEATVLGRFEQSTPRSMEDLRLPISRPASFYLIAFGGEPATDRPTALERLQLMINSSAPVIAHRELEAQTDLRKSLIEEELNLRKRKRQTPRATRPREVNEQPARGTDDYAQALLDLALKATRSSVGNIYLASRDGESLELEVERGNVNPIFKLVPIQAGHSEKSLLPGVVGRVYERQRPLIINDVEDYERANPHAYFLTVTPPERPPYAELAVPIEQGLLASSSHPDPELPNPRPIGVLNVERVLPQDSAAGDFTPTDLSTLQTIALFFALRRSGRLTAFSADSLAWLTEATALNPQNTLWTDPPEDPARDIPLDMLSARPTLAHIAKRIFELTRSHSVTIRVVTPDQLRLIRFVSWPPARLDDDLATIRIDHKKSVNAWVARTGMPCYIPNLQNRPTQPFPELEGVIELPNRGTIRSELCLPIKAHGRLIGTLNLESRHRSDYPEDVAAVVKALAQQVGLAISQARRNDERRLFSFQARQASQAHRVLGRVDDLENLVESHEELRDSRFASEIDEIIGSIRLASDPELSRPFDIEPVGGSSTPVHQIIQRVLDKPSNKGHVTVRALPPSDMELPELVGQVLKLAADELLRNALRILSQNLNLPFTVKARFVPITRAGRLYLRAEIVNPIAAPLREELVRRLYRGPIRGDRTHMGAFVVGSFVRSVGGEVYVSENGTVSKNESGYFGVRLELPADATAGGAI